MSKFSRVVASKVEKFAKNSLLVCVCVWFVGISVMYLVVTFDEISTNFSRTCEGKFDIMWAQGDSFAKECRLMTQAVRVRGMH